MSVPWSSLPATSATKTKSGHGRTERQTRWEDMTRIPVAKPVLSCWFLRFDDRSTTPPPESLWPPHVPETSSAVVIGASTGWFPT